MQKKKSGLIFKTSNDMRNQDKHSKYNTTYTFKFEDKEIIL